MERTNPTSTHGRSTRREREGTPEPKAMVALPPWESFPLEDRHRLICTILQAARRQVEAHSVRRGLGR
jgi:hypothetical protein